jgi:N-acetylglutamate synthase-like GNAT family acetyltransferase
MIRPYTSQDWSAVEQVFLENVPKFFAQEEVHDLKKYLINHHSTYFVLMKREVIVGAGGYHFQNTRSARLSWDFVSPVCKGQGFGRSLIQHCIAEIRKQNPDEIEVWTSQLAFGFYETFGFKTFENKDDFWAKGLHLRMMKLVVR